jgi:hypothetical protein
VPTAAFTQADIEREYVRRNRSLLVSKAIRKGLFKKQLQLIDDPSKQKAAKCGRRAGKSHGAAAYLCETALLNPESLNVYIGLSRKAARRILWPVLQKFNREYKIGASTNQLELEMTFPNGSQIWLTGATDSGDIEKLRGSAYHLVVVDECASFGPFFNTLIEDVLEPALADYDGVLCLIGTPGAACTGLFYEITGQETPAKDWTVHDWTVLDNPKFPRWRGKPNWQQIAIDWLENKRQTKGWPKEYPTYLREWLGKWVRDEAGLVYKYNPLLNTYKELPKKAWVNILGVDLGHDDPTAFAVVSYSPEDQCTYLREDWFESEMTIDAAAKKIKAYREKYKCRRIVMDTQGLGKMIAAEIRKRYGIPVEPAEKSAKIDFIDLFNSDLMQGKFKAKEDSGWVGEASLLQWDEDRLKEDGRFANHICDGTLYAWRECLHWRSKEPEAVVEVGSEEFFRHESDKQKKRAIAAAKRRKRMKCQGQKRRNLPTCDAHVVGK